MVGVIDRQQAVAEQGDQVAEAALTPVEVLRVGDGDEVVSLGTKHEDAAGVKNPKAEDRPVLLITGKKDRQRIANDLSGSGEAEISGARRKPATAPPLGEHVAGQPPHRVGGQLLRTGDRRCGVDCRHRVGC